MSGIKRKFLSIIHDKGWGKDQTFNIDVLQAYIYIYIHTSGCSIDVSSASPGVIGADTLFRYKILLL